MQLTVDHQHLGVAAPLTSIRAATVVSAALLGVFLLDRATGATPLQHLYYLPIIFAGRRFGMKGGIGAALSAIALYHAANPHLLTFRYGESDVVQMALFLSVGAVTAKLTRDAHRLRRLAATDDLTGLRNLRAFEQGLIELLRDSRGTRSPVGMLVLDLDHLKRLNDQYGHLAGAEAVRTVGQIIGKHLPPDMLACRYGGDEFAVAIPRCTPLLAHRVGEGLRQAVLDTAPVLSGQDFSAGTLSISIGGSCGPLDGHATSRPWPQRDEDAGEALFCAADAALYRAKARGRNRVCIC